MTVRVVARIRPQQKQELEQESILATTGDSDTLSQQILRIPNPKNESEVFAFKFTSVYNQSATQQQIFDNEGKLSCREEIVARNQEAKTLQFHQRSTTSLTDLTSHFSLMAAPELARPIRCEVERLWPNGGLYHDYFQVYTEKPEE